ncbi:MAG: tetratricopeptide repeat protein [Muribaculaceae bacterium]|nr:tetratricopeptide repeat protein [Muribaculaceae bacterium]MDE6795179.1 tetratricopeptide repeat protein [Muribaculaceae bacterium]
MKYMVASLLIALTTLFPAGAFAQTTLADADSAYTAKEYGKAIELYGIVAETEGVSVPLLFNMGNAYYQEGDYGKAMLCYLRAKRIDPSQKELNANLRYLRSRIEDSNKAEQKGKRLKVTLDEPSFFQNVHTAIAIETASNLWAVWGAVCFILFIGGAALYIFTRSVIARKIGFFGGIITLICSVVFVAFAISGARAISSKENGVITAFKVSLLTEPGKESESGKDGVLTKGTEVRIVSEETDAEGNVTWYKVRLNSDYIGWVAADDLELI